MNKHRRLLSPETSRQELDLAHQGLVEVPLLGMHSARSAAIGLPTHTHPGNLEIVYLKKGRQVFNVGEKDYPMRGGDVFYTLPDEEHGNGANPYGRCVLYWIQLRIPSRTSRFLLLPPAESRSLIQALQTMPNRHFRGNSSVETLFEKAFRLAVSPVKEDLHRIHLASILLQWLLTVLQCAQRSPLPACSEDIQKVVSEMQQHPETNLSLEEMAHLIHLSPSRFLAKFKQETGFTPREYLLRRKIEIAKDMLVSDHGRICDIAATLGFASSQHFATVFRKFEHASPTEYRNGANQRSQR